MRSGDSPGIGRLREWAPSPAWPEGDGVFLLRPLLSARRAALREFLRRRGEPWVDDPANADARYARVRARQALTQPPVTLGSDDDAVAAVARFAAPAHCGLSLPRPALLAAGRAVARRVLSAAVVCAGGGARPPRSQALDRLLDGISEGEPASTLAGARIVTTEDRVAVVREPGEARRRAPSSLDGGRAGDGVGGETVEIDLERRLPRSTTRPCANTPSRGLSPIEGERRYERFRAATFQIADEAALRTTSSP